MPDLSRSEFLKLTGCGIAGMMLPGAAGAVDFQEGEISEADIKTALRLANLNFADDEIKEMVGSVKDFGQWWPPLREAAKDSGFMGMNYRVAEVGGNSDFPDETLSLAERVVELPKSDDDLAFMDVVDLGVLIRTNRVSSVKLTQLFLSRLKKYGPKLRCVVNLTEERALAQAKRMDDLLAQGSYLGPLHGIPFGVKDLFDAEGYPTTWGIGTRKDEVSGDDSDVVRILEGAGGVLVAKLSLGALAMGDVWYEGRTESPWDAKIGSSGSSAGSGSAVAAGLVPFAIGTETNGSLVSPAHNCRVTTLRPTFGSVSRAGAMALCWSLDKVGPICRTVEDCAVVFSVLCAPTGNDPSQVVLTFGYSTLGDLSGLTVGYLVNREQDLEAEISDSNRPWLKVARELGATVKPCYLPAFPDGMYSILFAECAAAFESFTRSEAIQDLEGYSSWPESFRSGRLIPAVEYIQADRYRLVLADLYREVLGEFAFVMADDRLYSRIYGLNATGIPQMYIPAGVSERGAARGFSMICSSFAEGDMMRAGFAIQRKMGFERLRPDMSVWG
ncbi:amidase [bacterium]|nr:amidase [bacterium]